MTVIEELAIVLFNSCDGLHEDEKEIVYGKDYPTWETIEEWQRDDYRYQAEKALEYIEANKPELVYTFDGKKWVKTEPETKDLTKETK